MDMEVPRFALNHIAAPGLGPAAFIGLARALGMAGVEIRNDLAGNAILDGTPAATMAAVAGEMPILAINALQRFNDWTGKRAEEAEALADYARGCGARALLLVPTNDGSGREEGGRQHRLGEALAALAPILAARGLLGFVEPLGFAACSLRLKSEVVAGIDAVSGGAVFRLVHDTFHHRLAGEAALYPERTGIVHVSGVSRPSVAIGDLRDEDRILVDSEDRLGNLAQIAALRAGGYGGPLSFEPFAREVQELADPEAEIRRSMTFIARGLQVAA